MSTNSTKIRVVLMDDHNRVISKFSAYCKGHMPLPPKEMANELQQYAIEFFDEIKFEEEETA